MQNHKLVVSVCQEASGRLPKDLSKTNLDSHSSKYGGTDQLSVYVIILSKAACCDNTDLTWWIQRSGQKHHVFSQCLRDLINTTVFSSITQITS